MSTDEYHYNFYSNQERPHLLPRNMCGHLFLDACVKVEMKVKRFFLPAKNDLRILGKCSIKLLRKKNQTHNLTPNRTHVHRLLIFLWMGIFWVIPEYK